ncbi:ANTAR domain-containing protein [Mycolicibacterium sp. CAU 1645]|uniref:ANTAR domain-containing protein n=2 Tax=Mycolicibacterium arenosum TaxID=2952157 RepID=A0ABT1LYQ9_9MYCO|nr:ANTAR domain-containing protein [Mycolicibacterium sp. CAU 1645]MCP9271657.1 ANTAR domain-containing protein [Mycolicibacterium sp. CAU 1645]
MGDMSSPKHDLALRMAELARSIAPPIGVDAVLHDVSKTAKELIPGVDEAGILLVGRNNTHETLGPTSSLMNQLDELQMKYHEGPCLEAALDEVVIRTDDFRDEPRFPNYAPEVVKLGVLSALSFKLYTADRTAGALNLFGFQPNLWDSEAETIGMVLAAHAAAAILASREGEQLQSALSTRDRIGQAKGIIMERFKIDDVRAFGMLRQLSQDTNTKLIEVAQRVIDTRGDQ